MSTPALVRTLFPEFSKKQDEEIQPYIDIAVLDTDSNIWGARFDSGSAYLTAHLMTMVGRSGGAAGPIIEDEVGDLRRKYGFVNKDPHSLLSTSYGSEYMRMRRGIVRSPRVSGET